jgi:hypothetical protein
MPSTTDTANPRHGALPGGLVMRDISLVESIENRHAVRASMLVSTWQCRRYLCRDFNWMSWRIGKLRRYQKSRDANMRATLATLQQLLDNLVGQGTLLQSFAETLRQPEAEIQPVEVRVVSRQAEQLLDALMLYDGALCKLVAAYGTQKAMERCGGFTAGYVLLKKFLHQGTVSRRQR